MFKIIYNIEDALKTANLLEIRFDKFSIEEFIDASNSFNYNMVSRIYFGDYIIKVRYK